MVFCEVLVMVGFGQRGWPEVVWFHLQNHPLSPQHHPTPSQGDLLSLVSAIFYALYYMFVGRNRQSMSTLATVGRVNLTSTMVLVAYCLIACR